MAQYISFELESGETILVEAPGAARANDEGFRRTGAADIARLTEKAKLKLEEALRKQVRPVAKAILDQLKDLTPDEISVEFGVKLNAEAGAILASYGGEVSFNVTLAWKAEKK